MTANRFNKIYGCLLGGAIGDALGAPIEFLSLSEIRSEFGSELLTDFVPAYGATGSITDDTQMTLFTLEGLIAHEIRDRIKGISDAKGMVQRAYLRWFETQSVSAAERQTRENKGALILDDRLFASRAPGNTCLAALRLTATQGQRAKNDSKGCGSVMRSAPFGFLATRPHHIAELAAACSHITHGHQTAADASAAFALIIHDLINGKRLAHAIDSAVHHLNSIDPNSETVFALREALRLSETKFESSELEKLGGGWIAEEALAIAIACARAYEGDPRKALLISVNHSGDSDSTGSICGNLLGALHGVDALPSRWRKDVELADLIEGLSKDFCCLADNPSWFRDHSTEAEEMRHLLKNYPG